MADALNFKAVLEQFQHRPPLNSSSLEIEAFAQRCGGAFIDRNFPAAAWQSMQILARSDIKNIDVRHLTTEVPFESPLVLVKGAKNTGKTSALKGHLSDPGKRVLVISHRNTLARKLATDYGLTFHLDKPGSQGWNAGAYNATRLAVTLNSLWKVQRQLHFDVVVVDESEQVLAHLFGETMRGRENLAIHTLYFHLRHAKQVIALDADLGWATLNLLGSVRDGDRPAILQNIGKPALGMPLRVYRDLAEIEAAIISASRTRRSFVVSDEKRYLTQLRTLLLANGTAASRILMINSDTIGLQKVRKYLANPGVTSRKYDVVLASPTISSGIDIAFEKKEPVYECLFGIYHGHYFTHYECDQLLGRVRNPGEVAVWITGRDLSPKLSAVEHVANTVRNTILQTFSPSGQEQLDDLHPILALAQMVASARFKSRQNMRDNFIGLKMAEGWILEESRSTVIHQKRAA